MSRNGDLMRRALKRHFLPALAAAGFTGKASNYLRLLPDAQDLLSLQYAKYGGSFILEFGRRERGPFQTSWGPVVAEEAMQVAYLLPMKRARLQEAQESAKDLFAGFSFQDFGEEHSRYETLALRVANLLPQVDSWLTSRAVGPNVHTLSRA